MELLKYIERTNRRMGPAPADSLPAQRSWKHMTPSQWTRLRNLLFSARTIVEGAYAGRHRSPFKGASPEFVDFREYYPGDDLRTIDWKAVARTDRLCIRMFEKQTDLNCHLMVDLSASMAYGGRSRSEYLDYRNLSKMDYALCLASALAYLMIKQGDKAGLTLFDRQIRRHFPPGGTFGHLYQMLSVMEHAQAREQTDLAQALRMAFPLCNRRGLAIVISDFIGDEAELFRALNLYRHRGFEILLFHILHDDELNLPDAANVNFVDSETREIVNTHPRAIRDAYRARIAAWLESLRAGARARRIDYQMVSTSTRYEDALQRYLLRRSRL